MTAVHIASALQRRSWGHTWQRVALHYRVRDYAAVMDAVCAVEADYLIIEQDDWMIEVQSVTSTQATLLKMFLSHPEDVQYCKHSKQVTIFPIRDLRDTARCLRMVVPQSQRALVGRLILDLADSPTFGALHLTLANPFVITPPIRHPVLLDIA
ncbi:hypothetical protein ACFOD4_04640 [Pseudoroseomonas globiformis]|uniref:Uncharacterized protein n=1 Tax=Teichococcus globiformis TaxID=2307229 RepID=A0ABV7FYT4_9PROT